MTLPTAVSLQLPAWIGELAQAGNHHPRDEDKVGLAIALADANVRHGSGGPFGAAIFEGDTLVAVGVNRVVPQHCSVAHAEMMVFMLAQQQLQRFRLNQAGGPFTLATSAQPCCQCYGATVWAGIDRLLIGARAEDVERLAGFDEGPLPAGWQGELEQRGIQVRGDILRAEACEVLTRYQSMGPVY
ncbi:nucleoside deaminase [Frateuria aurantia]|uniref:Cytosine/adenosine deaminase n=1 Tax=Frateuria aurantia (strain ATCC 33424 / DSM 6220 / KCTC 2777 / LMG 1558 / NBRC 3245 / NCIMB 13370) TaxID=767434 RepID=H8L6N0_FRAAD|nr:nucleoside deaminase [Frateuria aurantia]AFC86846.1 cytosine/adenosine deaminase [Frateuria aurantia DSM 6220]